MDKWLNPHLVAQALGAFLYMVSEAVLGKTRFGSWLGLARATVWFILGTLVNGCVGMLKKMRGTPVVKQEEKK